MINLLLFSLFIAACANSDANNDNNDDTQKTADVSMQSACIHEYSSASFYAAVEVGHFKDANINLELIEGGFGESRHIEPTAWHVNGDRQCSLATSPLTVQVCISSGAIDGGLETYFAKPIGTNSFIRECRRFEISDFGGIQIHFRCIWMSCLRGLWLELSGEW